mmetsp:Transcript_81850/g.100404  ORF Transcript_81850/g.100404 Transcript_81850/m.100404 type:complete len:347 (-) Transcript_81850:138-1178(-)
MSKICRFLGDNEYDSILTAAEQSCGNRIFTDLVSINHYRFRFVCCVYNIALLLWSFVHFSIPNINTIYQENCCSNYWILYYFVWILISQCLYYATSIHLQKKIYDKFGKNGDGYNYVGNDDTILNENDVFIYYISRASYIIALTNAAVMLPLYYTVLIKDDIIFGGNNIKADMMHEFGSFVSELKSSQHFIFCINVHIISFTLIFIEFLVNLYQITYKEYYKILLFNVTYLLILFSYNKFGFTDPNGHPNLYTILNFNNKNTFKIIGIFFGINIGAYILFVNIKKVLMCKWQRIYAAKKQDSDMFASDNEGDMLKSVHNVVVIDSDDDSTDPDTDEIDNDAYNNSE